MIATKETGNETGPPLTSDIPAMEDQAGAPELTVRVGHRYAVKLAGCPGTVGVFEALWPEGGAIGGCRRILGTLVYHRFGPDGREVHQEHPSLYVLAKDLGPITPPARVVSCVIETDDGDRVTVAINPA